MGTKEGIAVNKGGVGGGGGDSTYINNINCVYLSPLSVSLALFALNRQDSICLLSS